MFFGNGMFSQLPQQQEVAPIQPYQTRVSPGSGQVLAGRIPQTVDQSLVPYANQQTLGVGSANTFGMPQGMPSGATPRMCQSHSNRRHPRHLQRLRALWRKLAQPVTQWWMVRFSRV